MNKLIHGDCLVELRKLDAGIAQTCVTSPPYYGLRDYKVDGQIGLEQTPAEYIARLVAVFAEVRRVLKDDGTLWMNLGDSYASDTKGTGGKDESKMTLAGGKSYVKQAQHYGARKFNHDVKTKDLLMIPARVALALQADGWYLRSEIIWHKPNPMPESVKDRPTKSHEMIYLLAKSAKYYYDADAVMEKAADVSIARQRRGVSDDHKNSNGAPGQTMHTLAKPRDNDKSRAVSETRNRRDVWTVATKPYKGAHFATFPPALIEPCILAGSAKGDIVLDPFNGSGTTGAVSIWHGRDYIGIELNADYIELSKKRIQSAQESK